MAAVAAPLIAPPLDVSAASSRRERMLKTFEGYRDHFDAAVSPCCCTCVSHQRLTWLLSKNERRERLIISSRQITALSKKAIFHIHRASLIPSEEGSSSDAGRSLRMQQLLDEAHAKIDEIKSWLAKVSEEIQSSGKGDAGWWQFARNVSPGLQEFLEAVSFLHYIEAKELISPEQLRERLADDAGHPVLTVPAEDYVLGISDLSGELMRYATNCELRLPRFTIRALTSDFRFIHQARVQETTPQRYTSAASYETSRRAWIPLNLSSGISGKSNK